MLLQIYVGLLIFKSSNEGMNMWTRSSKKNGTFQVVVKDWNGETFAQGEFADFNEANKFGEENERRMTVAMQTPKATDAVEIEMSDDELIAALRG